MDSNYISDLESFSDSKWTIELLQIVFNRSMMAKKYIFEQNELDKEACVLAINSYNQAIKKLLKIQ